MPNEFIGYKNQIWKKLEEFEYTGSPQEISLDAGTYLFMCKGARGGSAAGHKSYGGISLGQLTIESPTTMYAYVGGDGHTYNVDADASGGWNGGGDGGPQASGGGGATDIRLLREQDIPDPTQRIPSLPEEYQQVEYIDTGDEAQYIDLGTFMTRTCHIRAKINIPSISDMMTLIGASGSSADEKWNVKFDSGMTVNISDVGEQSSGVAENTAAVFELSRDCVTVNGSTDIPFTIPSTNMPAYSKNLYLFANNDNGTADTSTRFKGRLYYLQINDNETERSCPYFFHTATTVSVYGRNYVTTSNPCFACVGQALYNGSYFVGPYIVSYINTPDRLYDPYGGNNPFTYNDETWYESGTPGWMDGTLQGQYSLPTYPYNIDAYVTANAATNFLNYIFSSYGTSNVIMELIPCYRKSDGVVGVYDTISKTFITGAIQGASFTAGPAGDFIVPAYINMTPVEHAHNESLLTRIMVAGGGGGRNETASSNNGSYDYNGFGGGIIGGPIDASNALSFDKLHPSQTNGYSFGTGEQGSDSSCGAGGGWYGGFAVNTGDYGANGSGGSGYVLTSLSYKPLGYHPDATYYFTDFYMSSGKSDKSGVVIYEQYSADDLKNGDTIIFIPTNESTEITLPQGSYKLQCWGGGGGTSNVYGVSSIPQGGYAEGVLTLDDQATFEVFVGGSGYGDFIIDNEKTYMAFPELSSNGGGLTSNFESSYINTYGRSGGGATDIIVSSSDVETYTIPDEYQPVDYAEFHGTEYIDTGIVVDSRRNVELGFTPSTVANWMPLFASASGRFSNELSIWIYDSSKTSFRYGTIYQDINVSFDTNKKYIFKNVYGKLYINDSLIYNYSTIQNISPVNTSYIGYHPYEPSFKLSGKYHYLIQKDNQKTLQYLIPCVEVSSSEVGFYDLLTGTFFRNLGSGALTAGPNIIQREYRIVDTSNGLNDRIIVAGGAGGSNGNNVGGAGGGTTGGSYSGTSGSNPGPGTQTESPASQEYQPISGEFGFGGMPIDYGAAGGAGWYGGGGSYCSTSISTNMSGAGGSGFIYTENATVPVTYNVDPKYQLTNDSFARPIFTDPEAEYAIYFMPRAVITVLTEDDIGNKFLCRDTQGVKYFDIDLNQWILTQEALTEDLFLEKGYSTIPNDVGLLDSYEVLVYDPNDNIGTLEMNVCPGTQHITGQIDIGGMDPEKFVVDTSYDPTQFAIQASIIPSIDSQQNTTLSIDISLDKLVADETSFGKIYSIIAYGKSELLGG